MQGGQSIHTNVIRAAFTPKVVDGGKVGIVACRRFRIDECVRDLSTHIDAASSEHFAPECDSA